MQGPMTDQPASNQGAIRAQPGGDWWAKAAKAHLKRVEMVTVNFIAT